MAALNDLISESFDQWLERRKVTHPFAYKVLVYFKCSHLQNEKLKITSLKCQLTARETVDELSDSPELTAGLRKLLEAKDCFVRAALDK